MRVQLAILICLLFLSSTTIAIRKPLPKFSDYPATDSEYYKGPHKKVMANQSLKLWPYINASRKPDFAGHYIVAGTSGGTCQILFAIIDARTGKVCDEGFSIAGECLNGGRGLDNPLQHRVSSRLLIVHGDRNEEGKYGTYYYIIDHDTLTLIRSSRY